MLIGGLVNTGDAGLDAFVEGVACAFTFGQVCPDADDASSGTASDTSTNANSGSGSGSGTTTTATKPEIAAGEAVAAASSIAVARKPFTGNVCFPSGWCGDVPKTGITYTKAFGASE